MADVNANFDPEFSSRLDKLQAAAAAAGIKTHLISGVRSTEDQRQLYANYQAGRVGQPLPYPARGAVPLAAIPGSSMHEKGLAADVEADDPADQAKLRALGNQAGLSTLGAKDPNHFEYRGPATVGFNAQAPPGDGSTAVAAAQPFKPYQVAGAVQPPPGTTINASSAPVAGALAAQPPKYTFNMPENAPMGMGNNNPLNIKYYKGAEKDYPGLTGPSKNTDQGDPQMVFGSPEAGWSAAYSLLNKKYGGGMTTPNQIIAGKGGWTPGNTQAAANVAKAAGIGPNDDINFSDPASAQKFMRALVTQEQGAAGKAYPDEMIAGAVGGAGGGSGTAVASTTPATSTTAPATAAPDSWYGALTKKPEGGGKSPMEAAAAAFTQGPQKMKDAEADQAPDVVKNYAGPAPAARNVSPGLANIAQTYGQTLNSFSQPLTWNDAPPRAPQTPAAGLQGGMATQAPGTTLNSFQPYAQGLGYGINPVGYGFG